VFAVVQSWGNRFRHSRDGAGRVLPGITGGVRSNGPGPAKYEIAGPSFADPTLTFRDPTLIHVDPTLIHVDPTLIPRELVGVWLVVEVPQERLRPLVHIMVEQVSAHRSHPPG
jgi:hypothetical protein